MTAGGSIDDLDLLVGRWVGLRVGDAVEEVWSRVAPDAMMGMFCWRRGSGPHLYELLVIEQREAGVVLSMRTFASETAGDRPDGRPLTWRLVRSTPEEATFDGVGSGPRTRITYRRPRPDRLHATLEREEGGRMQIFPYHYRLADWAPAEAEADAR
ncbi:DUF6265 family protein [Patulibacter sp. S7RM1-6]